LKQDETLCQLTKLTQTGVKNMEHIERRLEAQVAELADLVGYQDGSVVSREIISKKTGTVTLFAFDQGQGLSEHTAPFDALVYVFDGEAEITISGKPLRVKQGEMVIMPANQPHALKAIKKFKMILTMIRA
jgi:quercetin dioxygenase-like cupin family protein